MLNFDEMQEVKYMSSCKGNQTKFYSDGYWYKIDSLNNKEGLAEEFVSKIESCIFDFKYVEYKSIEGLYKQDAVNACCCKNMYSENTQFITFKDLFRYKGIPHSVFIKYADISDNIESVLEILYNITGLNLLNYLRDNLFLDALIINEDRHWMNLGVCYTDDKFHIAPVFDNGSSLFCVDWTYRESKSFDENIKTAELSARPFSKFYDRQVDALLKLGCKPLRININTLYEEMHGYHNVLYDIKQVELAKRVLLNRLVKYKGKIYV